MDQKLSSKPFTKWSLDQRVYLFSMTCVYVPVHSHIYISVGEESLKLLKVYCNGVIFKLKKLFAPCLNTRSLLQLIAGTHIPKEINLLFLKKKPEVKDTQLLSQKLTAWEWILKIPLISSSSLTHYYNANYQSWRTQLIDCITRL